METIHIATSIDQNYVQPVAAMLCSLFENNHHSFRIYLFQQQVEQQDLKILKDLTEGYGHKLVSKNIQVENAQKFTISGHITLAAYFRVFLPLYVHDDVEKILYLDADLIVHQPLDELWNMDISNYALGAVENVTPGGKAIFQYNTDRKYFNSGVLLVNLHKWREEDIMQQTIDFINQNSEELKFHDQDALNAVLYNQWLPLHPKYNMQGALFMDEFEAFRGKPDEIEEAILNPVIIHYSTPLKPWHYLSFHPYTQEYYKYLKLTPWQDFKPTDRNLIRTLRKTTRPLLKKVGITKIFGKHLY